MAKNSFYRALNIEKEESANVLLFLSQSVFLGLFYGALDVAAYSLFLDVYPSTMLPKAYIVSGIIGIILTSLYTTLQSKFNFSRFAFFNLLIVAILALMLRSGFLFFSKNIIVFVIFVMYTPLNIIATLGFWGAVSRVFSLRQGKRIFGLIDSGQILGIILASYGATLLLALKMQTTDLLVVSSISIIAALILQFFISRRFSFKITESESNSVEDETPKEGSAFFQFFKKKYIIYLAAFTGFSMVATFFVAYSFMSVTKDSYPDTASFGKFIGAFTGTLMIFSLLIKTFIYGRLMKTYGLRTILLLSPVLLIIFTLVAIFFGNVFGFTSASGNFVLFFLIIALTRLFSKTLKDSFEIPAFKILYQSIDAKIRYSIQSRIDGTVNELSALASGLMLMGLASLAFIKVIHFIYFLLLVLIVWVYLAARLYKEYRNSLQASLSGYQKKTEHSRLIDQSMVIEEGLNTGSLFARVYSLEVARKFNDSAFVKEFGNFVETDGLFEKQYVEAALVRLLPSTTERILPLLGRRNDLKLPPVLKLNGELNASNIDRYVRSVNPVERAWGAYALEKIEGEEKIKSLKLLLRDQDMQVRAAAITTCGNNKLTELAPSLIEHLSHPDCFHLAFEALVKIADPCIEFLEIYFAKSGTEESTQLRIIRIYGMMTGNKVKEVLLNKMESFNRTISIEAIKSLKKLKVSFTEDELQRVFRLMTDYMGRMAWTVSLHVSLLDLKQFEDLSAAIDKETHDNYDVIMDLLSLAFEEHSVLLIKENLDAGTKEGAGYALELMDIFVNDELKRYLFPLFEDNTPAEKLRVLQEEYPVLKLSAEQVLKAILNRSRNELTDYTKLMALYSYPALYEQAEITDDIVSHLFNPDINIAETAAWINYKLLPSSLDQYLERIDIQLREEISQKITKFKKYGEQRLFISFVRFLKQQHHFSVFSGEQIREFAARFNRLDLDSAESLKWTSSDSSMFMFIVLEGTVSLKGSAYFSGTFSKGEIVMTLPLEILEKESVIIEALDDSQVAILDRSKAEALIFDHPEYRRLFLDIAKKTNIIKNTA
jgi:AAA family ATP:ADP antiporter